MRVEYIANINHTGYGRAAKAYIARLLDLGYDVYPKATNVKGIQLDTTDVDQKVKDAMDKNLVGKPDIRIIHEIPNTYAGILHIQNDGVYTIWFYAWELDVMPPMYKEILGKVNHCVTFAEWQVDTYKKNMLKDNISYLPHVMPFNSTKKKTKRFQGTFTFFSMFRWDERKDPLSLIKAFLYEFNAKDSVRLIIKCSATTSDQVNTAINNVIRYSKLQKPMPPIMAVPGHISQSELEGLYLDSDVFVSPTRGEGWGYGFNEALLYGVPCIYPDTPFIVKTFFNESNSIGVPTTMVPVYNSSFPQVTDDMIWSQINEQEFRKTMRNCYENYDKLFKLPVEIDKRYREEQATINDRLKSILALAGKE